MRNRFVASALALSLFVATPSAADASAGRKCTKVGQVDQSRGLKCVRKKGKLTWVSIGVAPGEIRSIVFNESTYSLSWGNPITWGNPVATYFAIEVRSSAQPTWRRIADLPINNLSASLSNLVGGVTYEFRVAAGNPIGVGGFATTPSITIGWVGTTTTTTVAGATTTTTIVQTTTTTQGQRTTFGNGTFRVGADVAPGLYQSSTSGSCYWERMSGFSGSLSDILANENVTGRAIVEIKSSDVGFKSSRCGSWSPYSPNPTSSFGGGFWKVGGDVQPGTYKTTTASSCYWARLSGFGGELDDILDNDNADGNEVIVQILPGDYGFQSSRCGTWTRI